MTSRYATCRNEGNVAILTLEAPERLNALTEAGLDEVEAALDAIERDDAIEALVVWGGTGAAFCAGLDFSVLDRAFEDAPYFELIVRRLARIADRLEELPFPTIAAVNGWARAAGFEIALACDFLLIADEAKFGDVHTQAGLIPIGGALRLKEKVGEQRAKELIWSARWWTAADAVASGLALKSAPRDALLAEALALAQSVSGKPEGVVARSKSVFRSHLARPEGALEVEMTAFLHNLQTGHARKAYLEMRASKGARR